MIDQTITIIDVDGDGNTTDDQRITILNSDWLTKNPKYQVQPGDKVLYIEDWISIELRMVFDYTKTR
jgi:hypothetical protein